MEARSLPPGTKLENRFVVGRVLGRGVLGITYLAEDITRGDQCVIREMLPFGSVRSEGAAVVLPGTEAVRSHLRHRFISDAKQIARLPGKGLLPIRAAFIANGTAYYVTQLLSNARSLAEWTEAGQTLDEPVATSQMLALLETLDRLHSAGLRHRDIRPSNILLDARGNPHLIDQGSIREWIADCTEFEFRADHSPYAAPEESQHSSQRGGGSDLYSLCATYFHLVFGFEHGAAAEVPAAFVRRTPETPLERALAQGLRPQIASRGTAADLRKVLLGLRSTAKFNYSLEVFDEKAVRLKSVRRQRFECPACHGVLERPTPPAERICPVCREGEIRRRKLFELGCPVCRDGKLDEYHTGQDTIICPICASTLMVKGKGRRKNRFECLECESVLVKDERGLFALESERGKSVEPKSRKVHSREEWHELSGRSKRILICRACTAQFDEVDDGRRTLVVPAGILAYDCLYPEEWARVAARLAPHAGNAECDVCGADYLVDEASATLVHFDRDPYEMGGRICGRHLPWANLKWAATGKLSPTQGYVCVDCSSEFDICEGGVLVITSANQRILMRSDMPRTLDDWNKIGLGLPTPDEIDEFDAAFNETIVQAFVSGQIGLDHPKRPDLAWSGRAVRFTESPDGEFLEPIEGTLTILGPEISHGGLLRKWRTSVSDVIEHEWVGDDMLVLGLRGEDHRRAFRIEPIELVAYMKSGARAIALGPAHLAARFEICLKYGDELEPPAAVPAQSASR